VATNINLHESFPPKPASDHSFPHYFLSKPLMLAQGVQERNRREKKTIQNDLRKGRCCSLFGWRFPFAFDAVLDFMAA
jgi:hypothetical protein